jgi:uncharacterized membrane protein
MSLYRLVKPRFGTAQPEVMALSLSKALSKKRVVHAAVFNLGIILLLVLQ